MRERFNVKQRVEQRLLRFGNDMMPDIAASIGVEAAAGRTPRSDDGIKRHTLSTWRFERCNACSQGAMLIKMQSFSGCHMHCCFKRK